MKRIGNVVIQKWFDRAIILFSADGYLKMVALHLWKVSYFQTNSHLGMCIQPQLGWCFSTRMTYIIIHYL
jgi:hypothetical protein